MRNWRSIFCRGFRIGVFASLFGFALSAPCCAVDLVGVYRSALKHDAQLEGARYTNLASREGLRQAFSRFLPTLTLDAETGGTHQNIRSTNNDLFSLGKSFFMTSRVSVTLNQPIYRHSTLVGVWQARADVKRSDLELMQAEQDLILRSARLYFSALAARDEVTFAEAEQASLERHFELVQVQKARGLASIMDLYEARARLATVEAQVIEAEDLWDDAIEALRELNSRLAPDLRPLRVELPLVTPQPSDVDAWIERAVEGNLRLKAQEQAVESAMQEISLQKAGRIPALNLQARENREKTGGTLFGGGSDVETANFIVTISVPVFQGGFLGSRIKEAKYAHQAAVQELERQRRALKRQVRSSFFGVTRAISRVAALEQAVRSQGLALEARQEGFRSGIVSIVAVLDAERDLFETRRDHARARYEYILNSLLLRDTVGQLSEADLLQVNRWLQ